MDVVLLDSRLIIALISTGLGGFLMFLIQMIVNKRGLFTALTPLYVKTAAQEASLSCWRVRKSLMTR